MPLSDKQQDQFNAICVMIAGGISLRKACIATGEQFEGGINTYGGFNHWRRTEDQEGDLALQYTRAREDRADLHADEIIEISDDDNIHPESRKIRIDARKWTAARMNRRAYGDKPTPGGDRDNPLHTVLEWRAVTPGRRGVGGGGSGSRGTRGKRSAAGGR